jgi:hypothetical protein
MCGKPNIFTALPTKQATQAEQDAAALVNAGQARPATSAPAALLADTVAADARPGSRRRRLWELPSQALCPVIGVCLPMPVLRRRLGKLASGHSMAKDYDLHCGAIGDCSVRTPLAEALQRELDQRYLRAVRQAAQVKTTLGLAAWWGEAQQSSDVAASLWATLTHARCDAALQEQVLRDIHMLQHQVGSANRADLQRLESLADENLVLGRELAHVQQRSSALLHERAGLIEKQAAELMIRRAEALGKDTLLAGLREEIKALEGAMPGLRQRLEQAQQIQVQQQRIHALERALLTAQQQAERERRRAEEAAATLACCQQERDDAAARAVPGVQPTTNTELLERTVLCVGGRQAVVPIYRKLIERTGGRFLHHDGGEEDAANKLDASLAAADVVICQTGCISHGAYWRVKDHCKRHGKRCVFVDKPSASSLHRALNDLAEAKSER